MKRLLTIGLMLVSAFALTNCAEEIAAPVQDDITVDGNIENITPPEEEVNIPFEVFATVGGEVETKTQNIGNGTYWVCEDDKKDQISVFHYNHESAKSTVISKMTHNKPFTIKDVKGIFEGGLSNTLGDTNDWYFLYPYGENYTIIEDSSSGSTSLTKVKIGKASYTQERGGSKNHIAGPESPMYGAHKGLDKGTNPEVNMNHLAAVVAIKVTNNTNKGPIMVKDVEFSVPTIYETDELGKIKKDTEGNPIIKTPALAVAGDCDLTIVRDAQQNLSITSTPSTETDAELIYSTKASLPSAVELSVGESITFYLPIRPFELNGTRDMSIRVNTSERSARKAIKFTSGKVTTFSVSVNEFLGEGIARDENGTIISDAFSLTSIGRETSNKDGSHLTGNDGNIVITSSTQPKTIKVNGQEVAAYILGTPATKNANGDIITEGTTGTITITGFLKDLMNALPIKFYVSTWGDEPSVMTVNKVSAWIPRYPTTDPEHVSTDPIGFFDPTRTEYWDVTTDFSTITKRAGCQSLVGIIAMGGDVAVLRRGLLTLFGTGVEDKITFSNIAKNGYYDSDNPIVLNEGFTQKEINDAHLNTFLKSFSSGSYVATAEGLRKIANAEFKDLPTTCVYREKRTVERLGDNVIWTEDLGLITGWPEEIDKDIVNTVEGMWGRIGGIDIANVVKTTDEIRNKFYLLHMLRDVKVSVELGTMSDGPCIVVWGLDADTPKDKADRGENAE